MKLLTYTLCFAICCSTFLESKTFAQEKRSRAREVGITTGILPTGKWNAITDVPGVKVGHTSVIEGQHVRTGVTAMTAIFFKIKSQLQYMSAMVLAN
jgi:D-aminopeptidase